MNAGRELDALVAEKVLGCKLVWRDVVRVKGQRPDLTRCGDHLYGKQPECRCDPWLTAGIGLGEHCHFGPAPHDEDEMRRCRAVKNYSENLELILFVVQDKWTDIVMESSGLNWTATTPIASATSTDLAVALCLAALKSVGCEIATPSIP